MATVEALSKEFVDHIVQGLSERGIGVRDDGRDLLADVLSAGIRVLVSDRGKVPDPDSGDLRDLEPSSFDAHLLELVGHLASAANDESASVLTAETMPRVMRRACPVYPWC